MKTKMMNWNSIMVCLDLSENDETLVNYAANLASKLDSIQEVILLHNIRFDFEEVATTFTKEDVERLRRKIAKRFTDLHKPKFEASVVHVVVTDSISTTEAIATETDLRGSDLILMGKKKNNEGMGIIPQKVLTTAKKKIPLLLVPSKAFFNLKQVVAAVDLSEATKKIVQVVKMLEAEASSEVTYFHTYKVPVHYFPYLETPTNQLDETLKQRAVKKMQQFQAELKIPDSDFRMVVRKGGNVSDTVIAFMAQHQAGLLVVGRLGRTNLFGNRIGGVTRTLLGTEMDIPLCIV